jgi:formylglycine-generating enzyme required for sulfatase activity
MFPSRTHLFRLWAILLALVLLPWAGPLMGEKAHKAASPRSRLEVIANGLGMAFVKIPAGTFMMGTSSKNKRKADTGEGNSDEMPAHQVTLSRAFYLQTTEVTQRQWKAVMATTPWAGQGLVRDGEEYPAVYVSWNDAQAFIQKLNTMGEGTYRLPTEAEWEYACRAGTNASYSFGEGDAHLGEYAWFKKNAYDADQMFAHRVGSKRPNPWGLYDMHGNVGEWCQDWKDDYNPGAQTDPVGPSTGSYRVNRGGGWNDPPESLRSAVRSGPEPGMRLFNLGFRVLRVLP